MIDRVIRITHSDIWSDDIVISVVVTRGMGRVIDIVVDIVSIDG